MAGNVIFKENVEKRNPKCEKHMKIIWKKCVKARLLANDMITWRWTRGSGCLVAKRGVPQFDSNREQYGGASFNSLPEEKTNIQGSCSIA